MGCTQGLIRFFYSVTARRRISMVEALGSAPTSKTKFQRRYGCRNLGGFETTFSPKNIEISWDVFGWKCQLHQHVSQRSMAPRWLYVSGKQARSLPFLHAIPHSELLFIEKYNTTSALRLGPSSLWRKRHEFLKSIIVSSAGREYLEYIYFGILSRARSARTQRGYCFQVHCHYWAMHRGQFWSEDVPLENFRKMIWLGCISFSDTLELSIRFR